MPEKYEREDNYFNDDRHHVEIEELKDKLTHLLENSMGNMDIEAMQMISSRMKDLLRQGLFWIKEENTKRFAYDLREFVNWLIEFIADKEREFWNE